MGVAGHGARLRPKCKGLMMRLHYRGDAHPVGFVRGNLSKNITKYLIRMLPLHGHVAQQALCEMHPVVNS